MKYQRAAGVLLAVGVFLAGNEIFGQRGGGGGGRAGGGGGGGGGGFRGGAAAGGGASRASSVAGPYGGGAASAGTRSTGAVVGPGGRSGVVNSGSKSGSITTKGGATIDYKGAGVGVSGSGGGSAGKVVGGIQVTGPGGNTATKVGKAGGVVGPGGNAVGGRSSIGVATGPGGSAAKVSRAGVAIGPGGAVVGKSGAVIGPNGGYAGYRGVSTGHQTRFVAASNVRGQAVYVRNGFAHYNCFRPAWYAAHPYAWRAAAWTAATFWAGATWGAISSSCGYTGEPIYYEYGSNVVYQDDQVYYGAEPIATAEEYAQQATQIATVGQEAKVTDKEDWVSLGVFGMVQGDEKDANNVFQLAINKAGIIRGNYYNAISDTSTPVFGSVDRKTQRAAWTVGDRKDTVYETGIGNLTEPETQMLVHFGTGRTQQWTLVRLEPPPEEK
ncbi:MAG TPA: hypothetical protein VNX28_16480 [Gemmataceae bacterium]|nr:hypothetical protein [Gemmataceae bacterium]